MLLLIVTRGQSIFLFSTMVLHNVSSQIFDSTSKNYDNLDIKGGTGPPFSNYAPGLLRGRIVLAWSTIEFEGAALYKLQVGGISPSM